MNKTKKEKKTFVRHQPTSNVFIKTRAMVQQLFKKERANTTHHEDHGASSRTVVHLFLLIIVIHVVVVSAVWGRSLLVGKMQGKGMAANALAMLPSGVAQEVSQLEEVTPVEAGVRVLSSAASVVGTNQVVAPITDVPLDGEFESNAQAVMTVVDSARAAAKNQSKPRATTTTAADVLNAPKPTPSGKYYTVQINEGWEQIAAKNKCSVTDLRTLNAKVSLCSGIQVMLPANASGGTAMPAKKDIVSKLYTIKKGDTLGHIAKNNRVTVLAIMRLNSFSDKDARSLRLGQTIKLP